jgi:hypothetical protein
MAMMLWGALLNVQCLEVILITMLLHLTPLLLVVLQLALEPNRPGCLRRRSGETSPTSWQRLGTARGVQEASTQAVALTAATALARLGLALGGRRWRARSLT